MSESKDELPSGWEKTNLDEIADVILGQSPPSASYNKNGQGLPFFQGKAEFTDLHPIVYQWCSTPKKLAKEYDILLSVRAPVGASNIADCDCCIGRGLAAIRYKYCTKYLFYYLRLTEKELDKQGTGTTFRAISGDVLRNSKCPLPPLAEQERIVAKIEELFSSLDKGVENLKTAREQLKVYRQAVLKQAFEGKLTNKNVKEGELPEGWGIYSGNDVFEYVTSGSRGWAGFYSDDGAIFLRMTNLNHETVRIDLSDIQYVLLPNKAEGKRSLVRSGDLLISITADVGMIGVVPDDFPEAYINQHIALSRPKRDFAYPLYVAWFFASSAHGQKQLHELQRGATKVGLGLDDIRAVKIPIPGIDEQRLVIAAIESRLSVCDKLEESIGQSLVQAEALRQSILKKAFEGKLVPQDPNDEPASLLLELIRAERGKDAAGAPREKGRRGRPRKAPASERDTDTAKASARLKRGRKPRA